MLDRIHFKSFARFVLPSVLLMAFVSIYTTVDGIFIARFVGPEALGGLNLVMPLYSIAFAVGIMFATGGGALIAIKIGRGRREEAAENFTFLIAAGFLLGLLATLICLSVRTPLVRLFGASEAVSPHARAYSLYLILSFPFLILKVIFEMLLRVDNKPGLALGMTLLAGAVNLVLDYLFMGSLGWGIAGAGLATFLGILISIIPSLLHFRSSRSQLRFRSCRPDWGFLKSTLLNGSSEMVNEAAIALTTVVLNALALRRLGDNGLAAVAVVMALTFLSSSLAIGFSMGVSPLLSYNFGRENRRNLQKILRYSLICLLGGGLLLLLTVQGTASSLVGIYLPPGTPAHRLALQGLRISAFCLPVLGLNIYGSAFFTAFENGKISALLSFLKSFVLFLAAAALLPALLGAPGIWWIIPLSETFALAGVFHFLKKYQSRYGYRLKSLFCPEESPRAA